MILEAVAQYIGVTPDLVMNLAKDAPNSYRYYKIPKANGGLRSIFHPSKQTKMLQYALVETILKKMPVNEAATGFIAGLNGPLRVNASIHAPFRFTLAIDLEDFFPSIQPIDFRNVVVGWLKDKNLALGPQDSEFLNGVLFVKYPKTNKYGLAIGAPSSPITSNIVMKELDLIFQAEYKAIDPAGAYSRYADDLVFSTNSPGIMDKYYEMVKDCLSKTISPTLRINHKKTKFMSRKDRRVITGLVVGSKGSVGTGRRNKRNVRRLVNLVRKGTIVGKDLEYLRGYLAFVRDVEPEQINNLYKKYGSDTMSRILNWKN
jgi:RNA-directed DNA polymerase